MAELTTQERLQPSLLDRLTDEEPGKQEESRERRVISATRLRDCVARDISWLLNCVNLGSGVELEDYPEVARSVLNFGIPDLTGMALAGVDAAVLQRQLREALLAFEPRLTGSTLRVAVNTDGVREILGVATGPSEAEPFWTDFLRSLTRRGLRGARLVISDAHEGLKAAVAKVLKTTWQRCRVHFLRNALAHRACTNNAD